MELSTEVIVIIIIGCILAAIAAVLVYKKYKLSASKTANADTEAQPRGANYPPVGSY